MAQGSAARRAAEQAARERLAGSLIAAVGELGVAVAARETAAVGMAAAQERAREHVRRAQREAQEMVTAARAQAAAADDGYRAAHQAATDAAGPLPRSLTWATRRHTRPGPVLGARAPLRPVPGQSMSCRRSTLAPVRRELSTTAMTWTQLRRRLRADCGRTAVGAPQPCSNTPPDHDGHRHG